MMGGMALDVLRSALVRTLSRQRRRHEPIRLDPPGETVRLLDGTVLHNVHLRDTCVGEWCCIHNPSPRATALGKLHWRSDRALMERICVHGVGHPDPDSMAWRRRHGAAVEGIHGCDGCCR